MKKWWWKIMIIVSVVVVVSSQYGHVLYSWFGIDSAGYVADADGKKIAYQLHGTYNQVKIDQCFKDLGIDPDPENLKKIDQSIASGALKASPALEKCIEQKVDGYASPRKMVSEMINSTKKIVNIEETVFEGSIFPQLGGAFIANAEAGYVYTISVSGRRSQRVFDPLRKERWYFTDAMADGKLPNHGNIIWIDPDPNFRKQLIDGSQPALMAVILFDKEVHFAHNGLVYFKALQDGKIKLTANCQQEHVFFNESKGSWHVEIKRKKML